MLWQMEAQVMLLRNLDMQQPSSMLVNGSRGVIIGFRKKEARAIAILLSESLPQDASMCRGETECHNCIGLSNIMPS